MAPRKKHSFLRDVDQLMGSHLGKMVPQDSAAEDVLRRCEERERALQKSREPMSSILRKSVPFPKMEDQFRADVERRHHISLANDPTYENDMRIIERNAHVPMAECEELQFRAADHFVVRTLAPEQVRSRQERLKRARGAFPERFLAQLVAAYQSVLEAEPWSGGGPRTLLSRHAEQVLAKLKVPADDETFGLTVAWLDSETGDGALTVEDLLLAVAESPATRAWVADFTW